MVADISMHSMFTKKRRRKEGESKDERIKAQSIATLLTNFFSHKICG